jgi:hypothetical protein
MNMRNSSDRIKKAVFASALGLGVSMIYPLASKTILPQNAQRDPGTAYADNSVIRLSSESRQNFVRAEPSTIEAYSCGLGICTVVFGGLGSFFNYVNTKDEQRKVN